MNWGVDSPAKQDTVTVAELQEALDRQDPQTKVIVCFEMEGETCLYEITDVSVGKGNPRRDEETHKATFGFDRGGLATWVFITLKSA